MVSEDIGKCSSGAVFSICTDSEVKKLYRSANITRRCNIRYTGKCGLEQLTVSVPKFRNFT
jgi:hypothetical protein